MQQMDGENFARLRFDGWPLGMEWLFWLLCFWAFLGAVRLIIGEPLILLLLARVSGLFFAWREDGQKRMQVSDSAMVGLPWLGAVVGAGFAGVSAAHHE